MNTDGKPGNHSEQREYELKFMLLPDEYRYIDSTFTGKAVLQTNHYFDTHDFRLYNERKVIRLRQRENTNELTVKTLKSKNSRAGVIDILERTILIDGEEADMLLSGEISIGMYLKAFTDINTDGLSVIGRLETRRKRIMLSRDLPEAELDESRYLGITDHELEWEISEKQYENSLQILSKLGINPENRKSAQSKYGRLVSQILKGRL